MNTAGWDVGMADIFRYQTVGRARFLAAGDLTDEYKKTRFPAPFRHHVRILIKNS
jgi:hypothetical protein